MLRQGEGSAGYPVLALLPFSEVLSFRGFESCNKQSFLANFGLFSLNVKHLIFKYFLVLLLLLAYFAPALDCLAIVSSTTPPVSCFAGTQPLAQALHLGDSMY